jgi:glycosyltransferase involved in cell wall biosynthesis
MKIGFLVSSISREAGGLFQSVRGLAKAMSSADSTVSVFAIRDKNTAADLPQWQPLSVHVSSPLFRAWGYSSRLLPALVGADLDVLFTHGLWKYCSIASHQWHRRTGRPYIVHPHGMLDPWALNNSKWKKRIAAFLYEDRHLHEAACIRALCDSEAESIRACGLRNPICVIPNGVDLPAMLASSKFESRKSKLGFTEGRKVLLYLGRLHPKKNLAALIKAFAQIRNSKVESGRWQEWVLAIAGWDQGGYEAQLKRLARELGLSFADIGGQRSDVETDTDCTVGLTSVAFLGPLFGEEKAAAYRACDAFVLPSLSEGLPMTVLEAWAYAKPVLMTPECNLPEGFTAGAALRTGTSADEIADGLKQLFEMSDGDRKAMGERGRGLVSEKFSWPQIGEEMQRVCEWVLGGGAPPGTVRMG